MIYRSLAQCDQVVPGAAVRAGFWAGRVACEARHFSDWMISRVAQIVLCRAAGGWTPCICYTDVCAGTGRCMHRHVCALRAGGAGDFDLGRAHETFMVVRNDVGARAPCVRFCATRLVGHVAGFCASSRDIETGAGRAQFMLVPAVQVGLKTRCMPIWCAQRTFLMTGDYWMCRAYPYSHMQ